MELSQAQHLNLVDWKNENELSRRTIKENGTTKIVAKVVYVQILNEHGMLMANTGCNADNVLRALRNP
jgi:hypothetical protein